MCIGHPPEGSSRGPAAPKMPSVQLPAMDSLGIRSVTFDPGAESGSQSRLDMTIQRLRWLAVVAPLAIVAALELARSSTLRFVSMPDRLLLHLIVAGSLLRFRLILVPALRPGAGPGQPP